jgi:hypothetical protein
MRRVYPFGLGQIVRRIDIKERKKLWVDGAQAILVEKTGVEPGQEPHQAPLTGVQRRACAFDDCMRVTCKHRLHMLAAETRHDRFAWLVEEQAHQIGLEKRHVATDEQDIASGGVQGGFETGERSFAGTAIGNAVGAANHEDVAQLREDRALVLDNRASTDEETRLVGAAEPATGAAGENARGCGTHARMIFASPCSATMSSFVPTVLATIT